MQKAQREPPVAFSGARREPHCGRQRPVCLQWKWDQLIYSYQCAKTYPDLRSELSSDVPAWTRSSAACCRWPCFSRRLGLDDPQRSLPTPTILWFCTSCTIKTAEREFHVQLLGLSVVLLACVFLFCQAILCLFLQSGILLTGGCSYFLYVNSILCVMYSVL